MNHPLMEKYKLGKRAPEPDSRDLMLAQFIDHSKLPPLPDGPFTVADLVGPDEWGMLANDRLGDCAPAGIDHAQLAMGRLGGYHPEFNDAATIAAYELMGAYDPGNPSSDQGCLLRTCAKVWQKHGVPDAVGHYHRSGIYLWLEPGNVQEQWYATFLFKNAINGYDLPSNAMEAFDEGDYVWDFDPSARSLGGHCVPAFGRVDDGRDNVSWGHRLTMTAAFIENKMDEGFTVVSSSILKEGKTPEALDHEKLKSVMHGLGLAFPE